ncbi:DNA-binding protein [Croceicoccus estronivorus]|uniref:YceD family protein n=1 Tax=Croceicoccus estronivorus TaxID=1172626 RepID=UPI000836B7E1|nr:DUF177 domain-containing protein [Croceicoccus estronivorus]OCC22427.1 DNA-binding protein [Croceicoccus estronivorus]
MTDKASLPNNEFSRMVEPARMGDGTRHLVADESERATLARRFALVSIERLEADVTLQAEGEAVTVSGTLHAAYIQSCAVSGDDLSVTVEEPVMFRFVPMGTYRPDEEVELSEDDCDEIEYEGGAFDLGEAISQSLALTIDPYATGPNAEQTRKEAGLLNEEQTGPFAALAALKTDKKE